ncbi:bifunctional UDP-N-acetylmuramoyl-L-alanyl-D-glutamate--2,6-diaminopimelate ligase MurE/UDP-N-acetylmuramoyl-tripeptide--D-alanyl-D-alanine ligase MurF [Pelistega europaea]|uniref:Multifunctional fusion protein n=1 Tax=Pelistega europaea TaxID=106147 RepID=A0A7Y4L945_9BURK|nr:bifunctional UDP-N-acetylmuramoyl-L-alanyl-D-glutamate--2,6-diaminopimelate ligase MurE/UDP-N-acetylmuramoyl-tripeptide--D-alanyl-D-alanine ligase MurF [Pelistega europaea]NOL49240.1 bifunctional UDP-N-acetylmuramoyl-L-alanyl-D-glutamate--2,6-diaminopimelate ligase MurE/UDP-N-acetylmuramoyl-tripeptide--D-alanyl-D-alanine ligase MurF [Pelistega europaea]
MKQILDWLSAHCQRTADLRLDSRDIQVGDVFVACKGTHSDGAQFIRAAVDNGAVAVLLEKGLSVSADISVPVLEVEQLRVRLGALGDAWYQQPSAHMTVIAITGTNGKTSCANWVARALTQQNVPCATIGTLGTILPNGENLGGSLTTPDVLSVHRLLATLRQKGIAAVTIEASSIGLVQGRMDNVRIKVAGFTNLTLDHLDIHHTMQEYERCKGLLFQWPDLEYAVINLDDEAGKRFFKQSQAKHTLGYSMHGHAEAKIQAKQYAFADYGLSFDLSLPDGESQVITRLVGEHNIANLLLTAGILHALGWSGVRIAKSIALLEAVPGRLEIVKPPVTAALPLVIVDYSHTPDSLQHALKALRPSAQARNGQLICVFGCGGDRDASKRPIMGKIAAEQADKVYVTSDNPRTEDPQSILEQILAGMPAGVWSNVDRAYTIVSAVLNASPNDVILIAGKGHETYQEIHHKKYAFDDRLWGLFALLLKSGAKINTDSRTIEKGEIFVALKGESFDGHRFLKEVADKGAIAAVVSQPEANLPISQIVVEDTLKALSQAAKAWRTHFAIPVIAVTGSNGKTTSKEMIASILQTYVGAEHCLATRGNLNNHIGVPLSLLQLNEHIKVAVFELGMNHPGEIALLADMTQAQVALVNNAQREHQEFMKTVEAVAYENGDVLKSLPTNGVAVYPADEEYTGVWDKLSSGHQRILFGHNGNVYATQVQIDALGTSFILHYDAVPGTKAGSKQVPVRLNIAGEHNVRNALAAAACALAIKVPLATIAEGLSHFKAVSGRMQQQSLSNGVTLINDTYNANPDSVKAAIDVLAQLEQPAVLVLGDMGEVGENGPQMHAEVGAYAREKQIATLLGTGELCQLSVNAFGHAGKHFTNVDELVAYLKQLPAKTILVKGSRFMKMERVVKALLESDVQ